MDKKILKVYYLLLIWALNEHFIDLLIIKDNFMLCKQNMNRPPIDLSKICTSEIFSVQHSPKINEWFRSIPKTFIRTNNTDSYVYSDIELALLTKSQYYVSGDAFECKQTNFEMEYNENFFGAKHSTNRAIIQKITKHDCITMVTTNKCGKSEMKCSLDKCVFNELPNDEDNYSWLSFRQITYSHCEYKIHKIHFHTKEEMAFSPKCQAQSGFCELAESVVYWNEGTIHKCPFHYVGHYNFTHSTRIDVKRGNQIENHIKSDLNGMVLGLAGLETHCDVKMLSTFEGLYVARPADMEFLKPKLISKGKLDNTGLEQNEIEKIHLSQDDYKQMQNMIYVEEIKKAECNEFTEILQLYAISANKIYFKLKNFEGNELYFYSYMGQVFRPDCTQIKEISTLKNQSRCYRDIPVKVLFDNQQLNMFLTSNGLIVDTSIEIDCQNHPKYMPLPNKLKTVIFHNMNYTLAETDSIRFEELKYKQNKVSDYLFKHNSLVLTGSDIAKLYGPVVMSEEHEGNFIATNERKFELQLGGNVIVRSVKWIFATIISYIEKAIMVAGVILIISIIAIIMWYSFKLFLRYRRGIRIPNGDMEIVQEHNQV